MSEKLETPTFSVIILNFNGKRFLEENLLALRAQAFRDLEIIFVDNGSSDGSAEWVASAFPDVRVVNLPENTGFARGNNLGIQQARGELIVLLNNDAVPDSHWLEELDRAARRHPEAGFFASRVVLYSERNLLDSAGDGFSASGTVFRRGHLRDVAAYQQEEFVFGAQGCAACYRRVMLDEVGVFDEDFFLVYEDADLSFRAQLADFKCLYVPSAIVYHHGGSTIGVLSSMYVYQSQRNVEYLYVKDVPSSLLIRALPAHVLYNVLGFTFFLFQGQGMAFLRAKRDAIRMLPKLLKKRGLIQSNIQSSLRDIRSQIAPEWIPRIVFEKTRPSVKGIEPPPSTRTTTADDVLLDRVPREPPSPRRSVVGSPASQVSVSVVIPCFNAEKTIGRALESVNQQTCPVRQVICVDDCSTDDTIRVIEEFGSIHPDLPIRILRTPKNSGPSTARNMGWDAASGDYVAFLDADDAWHPEKIAIQYAWMLKHPQIALCGHSHSMSDTSDLSDARPAIASPNAFMIMPNEILLTNPFVTPSAMLKRSLAYRFEPKRRYTEDYLLWMQMCLDGHRIAILDAPLAFVFKDVDEKKQSQNSFMMRVGDIENYWQLWRTKKIGFLKMAPLIGFSILKYILLITFPAAHAAVKRRLSAAQKGKPG